jgi:DNA-binding MarR family transcriptional regulator
MDRLVRDGLAQRIRSDADRRVVEVSISPDGLATVARLDDPAREMSRALLGPLGRDRLRTLRDLLGTLLTDLGTFAPPPAPRAGRDR